MFSKLKETIDKKLTNIAEEKEKKRVENIFEEIIAENLPCIRKKINIHVQED